MIKKLLSEKTDNTFIQFFRYLIVGGLAFLVDFGILTFLTTFFDFFKGYYLLANAISFVFGLITNYILSIFWVFSRRVFQKKRMEFLLFAGIGVIGLAINSFVIWLFKEIVFAGVGWIPDQLRIAGKWLELKIVLSKFIATVVVYIWNFSARKILLFKGDRQKSGDAARDENGYQ